MASPQLQPTVFKQGNPFVSNNIRVCPECAGPVVRASGCASCRHCGWGRCG